MARRGPMAVDREHRVRARTSFVAAPQPAVQLVVPRARRAAPLACGAATPARDSQPFPAWLKLARSASTVARMSLVVWGELIDEMCHAHAALDGGIVLERQLRGPLHPQLACKP